MWKGHGLFESFGRRRFGCRLVVQLHVSAALFARVRSSVHSKQTSFATTGISNRRLAQELEYKCAWKGAQLDQIGNSFAKARKSHPPLEIRLVTLSAQPHFLVYQFPPQQRLWMIAEYSALFYSSSPLMFIAMVGYQASPAWSRIPRTSCSRSPRKLAPIDCRSISAIVNPAEGPGKPHSFCFSNVKFNSILFPTSSSSQAHDINRSAEESCCYHTLPSGMNSTRLDLSISPMAPYTLARLGVQKNEVALRCRIWGYNIADKYAARRSILFCDPLYVTCDAQSFPTRF